MTATEHVILVDENDNPIGTAEKLEAHRNSLMHRAFSVFIFRKQPQLELLLQQRASGKYHCGNLWTNTCCSHPRPGEEIILAGQRRLQEELGIKATLTQVGRFHYIAPFANGLTENEVDHVLLGFVEENVEISPQPEEIQAIRWITPEALEQELRLYPDRFTPWFSQAFSFVK